MSRGRQRHSHLGRLGGDALTLTPTLTLTLTLTLSPNPIPTVALTRRQRSGSSGQPPTVDQMVALYFDKLESGVGELDRLLQIAETPANPPTDRPAPAAQESSLLEMNYV